MPEMINYIVKQTRVVKVTANSPGDACDIGRRAFANGQNKEGGVIDGPVGIWGNTTSRIRVTKLEVEEI